MSSTIEANQLLKGSGDVLINTRVPAFVACDAALKLPPKSPAAIDMAGFTSPTAPAASSAPAGIRMNVCSASHAESTPGVLSAKNSTQYMNTAAAITSGSCTTTSVSGKCT